MPSYEEVIEARAADAAVKSSGPTPQQIGAWLRESQRGAAVLDELLGSVEWDLYRSILTPPLTGAEAERAALRERVEAGELVGDERAKADLRLQYLRGYIAALQFALGVPKDILAQHQRLDTLVAAGAAEPAQTP